VSEADELDAKLAQARRELASNPHVVGVGFGYKERGGVPTQELSLRVYVREKKPPAELSADELVPGELLGIQTDVVTVPSVQQLTCEILDAFSPLVGGIGISNLKGITGGGTAIDIGTLGCFGTLNRSTSRDNIVVLTNRHVLEKSGGQVGDTLYQPRLVREGTGFRALKPEDMHAIGSIEDLGVEDERAFRYPQDPPGTTDNYYLDCAIAKVSTCYSSWCDTNCGVGWRNEIKGLNVGTSEEEKDALAGIARIRSADLPPGGDYVAYKVGRTTGRTVGKVTDAAATIRIPPSPEFRHNCVLIDHLGPSCEGGTKFSDEGDSGSVIVNDQRRVIALLFGATPAGGGSGSHIHPVVDALGITVISTEHNPDAKASNTLLEAPGLESAATARAAGLREQILRDERARTLRELVERHRDEVAHLVNRVRRVTVAWHRARGPDFLAHAVHASRHAGHPVPRELDGIGRDEAIEQMLETLRQNGSAPLRRDLERHGDDVRALATEVDDLEGLAELTRSAPGPR
jgi:hypothetical protein